MAETFPLLNPSALSDPAAFAARFGRGDWQLARHRVEGGTLRQLPVGAARLSEVVFRDVEFVDMDWKGAVFDRVTFENCRFLNGSMNDCVFRDCQVKGADFEEMGWWGVLLEGGRWQDVGFKRGELVDCTVDGVVIAGLVFSEVGLVSGLTGRKATITNWRVALGVIERVVLFDTRIEGLRLFKVKASQWRTTGGALMRLTVDESQISDWALDGTAIEAAVFNAVPAGMPTRQVTLIRCPQIVGLTFSGPVENLKISACPAASDIGFLAASVVALECRGLVVEGWSATGSTFRGPALLSDCRITHSDWTGSTIIGMRHEKVVFAGVLNLERARFERLDASGTRYAADLEFFGEGATFKEGASLGP